MCESSAGAFVELATVTSAVDRTLDRLIDGLTDTVERDRTVLAVLGGYLLVWTLYGIIAKSNQDLHPDMTELTAWSRNLALGYPKHPPFAAIVVRGWFALFPITDWSYYLLAILTPTLALWIAWQQFGDYLNPPKRLVAFVLLTFIPFFNFHALKFNVNTVLMPLWAATTFWFLRSYTMRSPTYAALAGVGGALCMSCKYWSIFLLAGLVVAALSDSRRASYFKSAAPWITVLTGVAVLSPHIGWLEKHNFSPMAYAMLVHGGHSVGSTAWADIRYFVHSIAYASVPIAVVLLAARPSLKTVADMAWPPDEDRRLVAIACWATLLLPILPALFWGVEIHGIWSMSSWTLFPVLLLSSPSVQISHPAVRGILGFAVGLPLVMLIAAPGVALVAHERGIPPEQAQIRLLAEKVDNAWQDATPKPLRYVGGDLADGVLTYVNSRPELLPDSAQRQLSLIMEYGAVFVCFEEESACITESNRIASQNPASRKIETQLSRSFFGIPGQPQGYVIFIVPPNAPS
jgi:Dolichyl-phosphate-mannose-protein mannosyltransferase